MKVLHVSTWKTPCGIAGYTGDLVKALEAQGVTNDVHPLNEWGKKTPTDTQQHFDRVVARAADFDVVHIQHDFAFFYDLTLGLGRSLVRFTRLLQSLAALQKPTVVTFHTEPVTALFPDRPGMRGMLRHPLRTRRQLNAYLEGRPWRTRVAPASAPAPPTCRPSYTRTRPA